VFAHQIATTLPSSSVLGHPLKRGWQYAYSSIPSTTRCASARNNSCAKSTRPWTSCRARCTKNPSQRGYHLTTKVYQKTVTKYVPQDLVSRVRAMTRNHLKVRQLLVRLRTALDKAERTFAQVFRV
jgi:hypothetical protein